MDPSAPGASAAGGDDVDNYDSMAQDALTGPLDLFGCDDGPTNDDEEESLFVGDAAATFDWMNGIFFDSPYNQDRAEEEGSNMAAEAIADAIASAETDTAVDIADIAADTVIQTVEEDENKQDDVEGDTERDVSEDAHEDKRKAVEWAASKTGSEEANKGFPDMMQHDGADEDQPSASLASRLRVVLTPVPEARRDDYATLPPSKYVGRIVKRLRGKNRFELEYDDGRRSEAHISTIFGLPNGQRALHHFRQQLEEADNEFALEGGPSKRRKTYDFRDDDSSNSDREMNLSEFFNGRHSDNDNDDDDLGESDLDDLMSDVVSSRRHNIFRRGRHLRSLADLTQSATRHSSRLMSATTNNDTTVTAISRGRQLRSRLSLGTASRDSPSTSRSFAGDDDDVDELAGDGDFVLPVQSDIAPMKWRRGGPRKGHNGRSSMRSVRKNSIEFTQRARPWRAARNVRSIVDTYAGNGGYGDDDDDDLYFAEQAALSRQQPLPPPCIQSVKEVFPPVEGSAAGREFVEAHQPTCDACSLGGDARTVSAKGALLYCQGCSLTYHKDCIHQRSNREHLATKVGPNQFVLQCRYCIGVYTARDATSPPLDTCRACGKSGLACAPFSRKRTAKQEEKLREENDGVDPVTPVDEALLNNAANVLFRCSQCRLTYHPEHLPWKEEDETDDISARRAERLAEYSIDWKCQECRDMPAKIGVLVAWRPANGATCQPDQTLADFRGDKREYLIKWEGMSYARCEWKPGAWVWGATHGSMRKAFARREGGGPPAPVADTAEAVPEEYLLADIVLGVRYKRGSTVVRESKKADLQRIDDVDEAWMKFQGLGYDDVTWDAPPSRDSGARWEAFEAAYGEYINGKHFRVEPKGVIAARIRDYRQRKRFEALRAQPAGLCTGSHSLMPYQLDGLNWLLINFYKGKSVVLADEMGLGKTVQVVALLATIVLGDPRCWPFLVVVPNATCANWRREMQTWAPGLRVVAYHGGREAQRIAYEHELFPNGSRDMRAHVVIMSYDSAQDDGTAARFRGIQWAGLVVDEGQRLKNDRSLLYLALRAMRIGFRLLLTGTPLQNNKRELFNLLQFVDSSLSAVELDKRFQEDTADNITELHRVIRPYFLRRTKADVLKFLPPMARIIVPLSMTVLQEKLCKSILAKNPELIRAIFARTRISSAERSNLNNMFMQLRKCLCHPFLYNDAIEEKTLAPEAVARNLIEASAKLVLLRIMLPKLHARGHRVLLFSQFLRQLDIAEDFLALLGLPYQRLDGSMSSLEKQKRIDAFNAPDSPLFAFLLSTRAGGVGINLATADTVIIMDPDFNPHQDMQAFSRAHRIGQKKKVLCFQLMTKDSIEEKIMQIARKKMALDHALIESMDADDDIGTDLESILKHGAEALFSDDGPTNRIVYDDAAVDQLLDRSAQVENPSPDAAEAGAESQFSFARVWAHETGTLAADVELGERSEDDGTGSDHAGDGAAVPDSVWENIIKEREAEAARMAAGHEEVLGRGGRRRTKVLYAAPKYDEDGQEEEAGDARSDDKDEEFEADRDVASSDEDDDDEQKNARMLSYELDSVEISNSRANSRTRSGSANGNGVTRGKRGSKPQGTTPKKTAKTNPVKKGTPQKTARKTSKSPKKTSKAKREVPVQPSTPKKKAKKEKKAVTDQASTTPKRARKHKDHPTGESARLKKAKLDHVERVASASVSASSTLSCGSSAQAGDSDTDTTISQQTDHDRHMSTTKTTGPTSRRLSGLTSSQHSGDSRRHSGTPTRAFKATNKERMLGSLAKVAAASRLQAQPQSRSPSSRHRTPTSSPTFLGDEVDCD